MEGRGREQPAEAKLREIVSHTTPINAEGSVIIRLQGGEKLGLSVRIMPTRGRTERWDHLRTTNSIERVFATVRHRNVWTKGALSPATARLMVFKIVMAAAKRWRRLKGENQLPKLAAGVVFRDGSEVITNPATRVA